MKRFRSLCAAFLAVCLVLGLSACGKKDDTTADSLMASLQGLDMTGHYVLHADLTAAGTSDGQAIEFGISMDVDTCGGVTHLDGGDISFGMSGMSFSMSMDAWLDSFAGMAYTNVSLMGMGSGWTKSALSDSDFDMASSLDAMWPAGTVFTLADRDKDQDYTVTWTLSQDALRQALSGISDEDGSLDVMSGMGIGDLDVGISGCSGSVVFDKDSKQPKTMTIDITGASIDTFRLSITFYTFNGAPTVLSVPQDVLDTAIDDLEDTGYSSSDYDTGYDDWSLWDVDENTYKNDGDGYDDVIDPMAESLRDNMPDGGSVMVLHYSDHAEMTFTYAPSQGDWQGEVEIRNVTGRDAETYFASDKYFYAEWYEIDPVSEGDDFAIYWDDGKLNYICLIGDMTVDATVYSYGDGGYDAMMSNLSSLLVMAGVG